MVCFTKDQRGAIFEPLSGTLLMLFDSRHEEQYSTFKAGVFLRMFVVHCRTGSCSVELMGNRTAVACDEACVVCSSAQEDLRCLFRCSEDFSGSVFGLSRTEMPEATKRTLRAFDVEVSRLSRLLEGGPAVRVLQGAAELDHAYAQLYALPAPAPMGMLRLRTIELAYALSHATRKRTQAARVHKPTHDEIARRAQEVLTRDLSHPLTIPATAQLCDTSATVLKQAFRETFGQPVHEWYRDCRMREAARLLETTSYSVAQVASEVGYSNPSKFSKAFCECMGSTPCVWRATHRV